MSYMTIAYGVDIDQLKRVYGSRDETLVAKVCEEHADWLDQFDQMPPPDAASVREGLREIVNGRIEQADEPAPYIYAQELLCLFLGKKLDGVGHIRYLDDLGWETPLADFSSPFDLPPELAFPSTSYLTAADVKKEYERWADAETEDDDPEVTDAREEYVWWLKQCSDADLGLVTFCY